MNEINFKYNEVTNKNSKASSIIKYKNSHCNKHNDLFSSIKSKLNRSKDNFKLLNNKTIKTTNN